MKFQNVLYYDEGLSYSEIGVCIYQNLPNAHLRFALLTTNSSGKGEYVYSSYYGVIIDIKRSIPNIFICRPTGRTAIPVTKIHQFAVASHKYNKTIEIKLSVAPVFLPTTTFYNITPSHLLSLPELWVWLWRASPAQAATSPAGGPAHTPAPANCKKQHMASSPAADPAGSPDSQPNRGGRLHAEPLGSKRCH